MERGATLCRAAAALALAAVFAGDACAQANADVLVTGTVSRTGPQNHDERATFSCRGVPTCSGTYSFTVRHDNCPNYYSFGGTLVVTGLDLAAAGPIQGSITITPGAIDPVHLPDGTCVAGQGPATQTVSYTATWDPATKTGTGTVVTPDGDVDALSFTADVSAPAPVFPMVVQSRIDAQTATASATIQFRPQDVGRTGNVYVFASAPSTLAKGAKADAPGACVLAQMSPSGQLVAITVDQLRAFLSGTLSAAGASVSILNGVPTPAVAGATFYVGYGPSGAAMLSEGVFRNAVIVPGSGVCPMLPSQTALWWNPAESGWGLNLSHQGGIVFGTLFTYDAGRAPLWLVMSNGAMQSDGTTYSGDLFRTTGPAFNANPFTPIGPGNVTRVGTMTVSFAEANAGTLRYTVNGVEVVKSIQRQVYGTRAANCLPTTGSRTGSTNYQDLWWNPDESGWGLNITHQDNTLFATLFTYDPTGRGLWLVMPSGPRQADGSYFGDLYRTTGPAFNSVPFTPIGAPDITQVGTMRLRFSDGENGTLSYVYEGAPVTKAIKRQVFSTPASICN